MAASMEDIKSFSRGDICRGVVLGFEPNGALVDIGVKSSAYVSIGEAALVKPDKIEGALEIGQEYEFLIVSREDENGQMSLSRRRILTEEAWETVAQMMTDDAAVDATVAAVNRGGAMLTVEGLRAFLPARITSPGATRRRTSWGRPSRSSSSTLTRRITGWWFLTARRWSPKPSHHLLWAPSCRASSPR